ncbi:hypothetical protein CBR_g3740 [Chara braunii]|uniref:Uncharacterized protein n=1 Tax=Chara braunii TaxID=69332 RepID=A0A388KG57_CHABU|nr:hypothetical protein CBR_g3740 [Chara braunii]|eukprot:GBG69042.1 hypothetical protein CBR_g3740 [Chara braunii]
MRGCIRGWAGGGGRVESRVECDGLVRARYNIGLHYFLPTSTVWHGDAAIADTLNVSDCEDFIGDVRRRIRWQLLRNGQLGVRNQCLHKFSRGYGRGNRSYQPRAFLTREHVDFIEKLKLKDVVEEARKKDLEKIARLRGLGWEVEEKKGKVPDTGVEMQGKGKNKKQGGKDKGKGNVDEVGKEEEMKKWIASNFGGSMRILSEKLEEVEKKSSLKMAEMEELKMLRAEKEMRELRENSSSEKKKRDTGSPAKRKGKVRSRSNLLRKTGRKAKPVEVSSDEGSKGQDAVVQNLSKIQELCKKKGVPYKRKEAGVWELARLDFEVLLKMEKTVEEQDDIDDEKVSEGSEDSSESGSSSDEEAQDDDIAGN